MLMRKLDVAIFETCEPIVNSFKLPVDWIFLNVVKIFVHIKLRELNVSLLVDLALCCLPLVLARVYVS